MTQSETKTVFDTDKFERQLALEQEMQGMGIARFREEIRKAQKAGVVACKYYPAGATTNSDFGVSNVKHTYPALEAMSEVGMMLCIHSEVTHADIFEREPVFIEEVMKPLVDKFTNLKIVMEHISTKEAVDYVMSAPDNVKASITCHHLLYNRNGE